MTPRKFTNEQLQAHIAQGKSVYTGYLKDHIGLIATMWAHGFSYEEIAYQVNHIITERIKREPHNVPYFMRYTYIYGTTPASAGTIRYVLKRCGMLLENKRQDHAFLPNNVAIAQARWERKKVIQRMKSLGFTHSQIGEKLGCSMQSIRMMKFYYPNENAISPIKKYFRTPIINKRFAESALVKVALGQLSTSSHRDWLLLDHQLFG